MDAPLPATLEHDWEVFLESESRRPPGLSVYDAIFNHGLLFPLQRKSEMAHMMNLARSISPRRILEIGSDKLGSFYHWVKCLPTVVGAIAIEYRGTPCMPLFEKAFPAVQFLGIAGSSYGPAVIEEVRQFLGPFSLDCVFIDGDKCGFDKDVAAYLPMVRNGGLIFLHDVQDVINAQETMRLYANKGYLTQTILDTSEYDEIEKREKAGIPAANSYEGWFRVWKRGSCGVGVIHV